MPILTTILANTGWGLLGWSVGKGCDMGTKTAHQALLSRLKSGKLDPNHDIERAILTAHYKALEFLVREAVDNHDMDAHGGGVINARAFLKKRLKQVDKNKIATIANYLAADWKDLIPSTFEGADTSVPETHIEAAMAELLRVKGWDPKEKTILLGLANDKEKGWVIAFSAYIREQLKTNDKFRNIYTANVLDDQTQKLDAILAVMPKLDEMQQSLDRIEAGQDESKERDAKAGEERAAILANQEKLLAMYSPQAQQHGVTVASLRAFIKRLDEELDLADNEMIPWLEGFIKTAQHKRNEKVNEDAPFQAALTEAQNRFDSGQVDTASDALMAELERDKQDETRRQEERTRRRIHLLKEAIDYDELALKPDAAVQKWRLVAAEQGIKTEQEITRFLFAQTDHYEQESERRGSNSAALVAIALWQEILTIHTHEKAPMQWAGTQNNLGNVYRVLGERGDDAFLRKAVTAYENALKEYTREKAPMEWAMTQNNLGIVYQVLGARGEDAALDDAVTAYENALKEYTREKAPMDWAMTQNNLGTVYQVLGARGDDAALDDAVTAYKNALQERTREKAPMDWAATQNNLGNVYSVLGERGDDAALHNAVTAYENALKERTREKAPMDWAATQNNLGTVYQVLGERGDDAALDKAVTAYENALKEYTREKAPMQWAMTQNNLGNVYQVLGERGDDAALDKAVTAYENALKEYTREKAPMQWAMTQNNLGEVYRVLGTRGDDGYLHKAVTAYENALKERTQEKAPMQWAMTTENLGYVLWEIGEHTQAEQCMRDALATFRSVNASYYVEKLENAMRRRGLEP